MSTNPLLFISNVDPCIQTPSQLPVHFLQVFELC